MRDSYKSIKAIIFGEGNYNSLGVLHQLTAAKIPNLVLAIGNPRSIKSGNIIGYSKDCKNLQMVESSAIGISWLKQNANRFENNTVIIPTSDTVVELLDEASTELSKNFRFPNAGNKKRLSHFLEKDHQYQLASECGLNVIKSHFTNDKSFNPEEIEFPCIIKTLNSTKGSKGDMAVCESLPQLQKILDSRQSDKAFIVQRLIKNEADILLLGISYDNGDVSVPCAVIKPGVSRIGEYTHAVVSSDIARYLSIEELDKIRKFICKLGYHGPFSIEFGLEKGIKYFFEINLRNDGTSQYPLSCGINLSESYVNQQPISKSHKTEYEMIDEVGDLRRVMYRELSFGKWLKSFWSAGSYRWYAGGDYPLLWPLSLMFIQRLYAKIRRK